MLENSPLGKNRFVERTDRKLYTRHPYYISWYYRNRKMDTSSETRATSTRYYTIHRKNYNYNPKYRNYCFMSWLSGLKGKWSLVIHKNMGFRYGTPGTGSRYPVPVLGCGGIFPESSPQLVNEKINPVPVRLGAVLYFDPGILQTW
jgi:hypothetical protein